MEAIGGASEKDSMRWLRHGGRRRGICVMNLSFEGLRQVRTGKDFFVTNANRVPV